MNAIRSICQKFAHTNNIPTTHKRLCISNWHKEHENLRFIFFSDLHANKLTLDENILARLIKNINRERPDFVFMGGDFVYSVLKSKHFLRPEIIAEHLKQIKFPKIAVLGNHDFDFNPDKIFDIFRRNDINVLRNSNITESKYGKKFHIAGVDDLSYGESDLPRALSGINDGEPTILLSHNPSIFEDIDCNQQIVTLAGHTHGGQVKFTKPLLMLTKLPFLKKYYYMINSISFKQGFFQCGKKSLYVTPGVGTDPIYLRYKVTPEIAKLSFRQIGT